MFPARVGMNRRLAGVVMARSGVPRASGDEPSLMSESEIDLSVFPARVGMNRDGSVREAASQRVPRASGDEPRLHFPWRLTHACSPREWG
ncbi:conserved hypothetical protein [Nitrospira defluvii]|uniref:Uncharacterized protein n=1 Tax=Nitrospira defluvii TaxID=330214 RepID=A0ABM8S408_9BACT|nr:conserved hypothetical protein [Nitrospira defluvii]